MSTTPKRAAVQAEVLRATEQLLAEGTSWADLGVEKIATTAGISRTAFYFYFSDKRDLLLRLTEEVNEQLYHAADRWWSGATEDEEEIRGALIEIADLYVQHMPLLRVIVEVSTYDEGVATHWRGLIGRFVDATRERIEAEQEAGKAPAFAAAPTAFALVWMAERTLYELMVQEPPFSRDEAIDALARIFMRGVYER